ncbi:MAG: CXXX repeat peptide modification system protein [Muribaculaceae bacterium]|nr:CXXX repeat peptide modification system protein [Muribaculaceae bacterium]
MRKEIGSVTEQERDEIKKIFERRNGLNELAKILTYENTELYEKLVSDMGETSSLFQNWWDTMSTKYQWESHPDAHWEIDFNDCVIYLVTPE